MQHRSQASVARTDNGGIAYSDNDPQATVEISCRLPIRPEPCYHVPMTGDPRPSYFDKALTLYNYLSGQDNLDREDNTIELVQIDVMTELGYPLPYAHRLREILEECGSIIQVQRGARNRPSIWKLIAPPTLEAYKEREEAGAFSFSSNQSKLQLYSSITEQRLGDLSQRVTNLEQQVSTLLDLLNKERKVS